MGEKPYSCPECGKYSSQKSHLYKHHRLHTVRKPYSCPECERCFVEKSKLVKHLRSHAGEKLYSCSFQPSEISHVGEAHFPVLSEGYVPH
ncbi:unnamed protein product [Staurois parvus]|uniref:C2H2-type domain-containing protein n=1 Tax=Staurois parvus TaxID=386267 RepID=A0ABN9FBH7_9NEOB|nr:unnamed protein product [Staurois parvus]